jgi:hypothetical protein
MVMLTLSMMYPYLNNFPIANEHELNQKSRLGAKSGTSVLARATINLMDRSGQYLQ